MDKSKKHSAKELSRSMELSWVEVLRRSDIKRLKEELCKLVEGHSITSSLYPNDRFTSRKRKQIYSYLADKIFDRLSDDSRWQHFLDAEYSDEEIGTEISDVAIPNILVEEKIIGAKEDEFIALTVVGGKLRLVSLARDGTCKYLDGAENLYHILYVVTSDTLALKKAVDELESLINDSSSKESDFQDFFERNPEFIINSEYKKAHPHIVLSEEEEGSLIPDFMLEPLDQSTLCDLLELKLPSSNIFVLKKSRKRFSAAVMEACAQLREYSAFFDEEKNRQSIQDKYGLSAYKPKLFVVIGRRGKVSPIELRKMEGDMPDLRLCTYDEVVDRAKWRVKQMEAGGTI